MASLNGEPATLSCGSRQVSAIPESGVVVLVSPQDYAHFPGCPHKGADPDLSVWARSTPGDKRTRLAPQRRPMGPVLGRRATRQPVSERYDETVSRHGDAASAREARTCFFHC
jgi:hypothetical protein